MGYQVLGFFRGLQPSAGMEGPFRSLAKNTVLLGTNKAIMVTIKFFDLGKGQTLLYQSC